MLWGVVGGLISLHTCLGAPKNKMATSCCCESKHFSQTENKSTDCCKTITSYVGFPLYFIDGKQTLCFLDCSPLDFSFFEIHFQSQIVSFYNTMHPPPDIPIVQDQFKRMLAMRI